MSGAKSDSRRPAAPGNLPSHGIRRIASGWAGLPLALQVVVACVSIQVVLVALNLGDRVTGLDSPFLDVEAEGNLATWWSSFQFGLAGLAAASVALLESGPVTVWGPIAAAMAFFSLDEVAQIHERLEAAVDGHLLVQAVEPVAALAILAFGLYALRRLGGRERILLLLAAGLLVAANVSGAVNDGTIAASSWEEHLLGVQEEWSEMLVGALVLAAALPGAVEGLRRRYGARPALQRSA